MISRTCFGLEKGLSDVLGICYIRLRSLDCWDRCIDVLRGEAKDVQSFLCRCGDVSYAPVVTETLPSFCSPYPPSVAGIRKAARSLESFCHWLSDWQDVIQSSLPCRNPARAWS